MGDSRFFRTKLCLLFQKGNCPRPSCSFAHGTAELRRLPSYNGGGNITVLLKFLIVHDVHGRRDYRGNDLRDKLERRQSPYRRSSPGKYVRGREAFQHKRDRGYSPSRSPGSGRRQQKRPHMNGQSDFSESLGYSDDADERRDDTRMHSNNDKDDTEEQLRQVQMDVEMLEAHKCELETTLEKTAEEAESLASRNEELEAQLNQVEEESKRIVSKIKKFVRAYNRYTQAQDVLKRTEARLRKFGDQLSLDASKAFASEDNSSLNFLSDVDADEGAQEEQIQSSPNRKMPRLGHGVNGDAKPALLRRRDINLNEKIRSAKFKVTDGSAALTKNYGKDAQPTLKGSSAKTGHIKPPPYVLDKVGKTGSQGNCIIDKVKSSDPGHALPATCMAAHAMDEFVEVVEIDDRLEAQDPTNASAPGVPTDKTSERALSIPPLPTGPLNAGNKYKGGDEDALPNVVDREGGAIDLNCEIEIE